MPNVPPLRQNPLLFEKHEPVVDPDVIRRGHVTLVRERKRDIRDLRRKESAAEAVAGLDLDGREIFGLTKGQFSLTDMIDAILEITGPAELHVSTWTAANTDVSKMLDMIGSGRLTAARWLVDVTFVRRAPQLAARIREAFGADAIRVTRTHAKFTVIRNDRWEVVCRTSMNLNHNPRLEDFTVAHDPELAAFLLEAMDDIWKTQKRTIADGSHTAATEWWHRHG
jgi:hypothetical protein